MNLVRTGEGNIVLRNMQWKIKKFLNFQSENDVFLKKCSDIKPSTEVSYKKMSVFIKLLILTNNDAENFCSLLFHIWLWLVSAHFTSCF